MCFFFTVHIVRCVKKCLKLVGQETDSEGLDLSEKSEELHGGYITRVAVFLSRKYK